MKRYRHEDHTKTDQPTLSLSPFWRKILLRPATVEIPDTPTTTGLENPSRKYSILGPQIWDAGIGVLDV